MLNKFAVIAAVAAALLMGVNPLTAGIGALLGIGTVELAAKLTRGPGGKSRGDRRYVR